MAVIRWKFDDGTEETHRITGRLREDFGFIEVELAEPIHIPIAVTKFVPRGGRMIEVTLTNGEAKIHPMIEDNWEPILPDGRNPLAKIVTMDDEKRRTIVYYRVSDIKMIRIRAGSTVTNLGANLDHVTFCEYREE